MILEFEKLNHKISLEIYDEPMITLKKKKLVEKSTYNYKLISIKVDGKEVDKTGNIYCFYNFEYFYHPQLKKQVFALRLEHKLAESVSKILVGKKMIPLTLTLPKEVEDLFKNELKIKAENLIKEKEQELDIEIKRLDNLVTDDKICSLTENTSYGYSLHVEDLHEQSYLKEDIEELLKTYEKVPSNFKPIDVFTDYCTNVDWGDYTTTTYYKMTYSQLKKCLEQVKTYISEYDTHCRIKKEERENHLNNLITKAKETGIHQEVKRWHENCTDPREACDVDIVIQYVNGNGEFKYERHHTW